ncbi:MAG: exosortase system-associated protein, TIGR04073 family [Candidatus Omnitrophica bacterium]|nr:exosortase system-associated protein, TIGR04073 family [Candidatus Omnitrophota bacterium]
MRALMVGLMLVLGFSISVVRADPSPSAPRGQDRVDQLMGRYNLHPALEKLGRGVSNVLGGWMEIPLSIHKRYAENDAAASLFTGALYGLVKGAVRTGVGVYETATFFLPYPEDFAPILPTLEYFRQPGKRKSPLLQ